jgi:hypothetical protein
MPLLARLQTTAAEGVASTGTGTTELISPADRFQESEQIAQWQFTTTLAFF